MSPLKLLSQDKIGDFLNLLPINPKNRPLSREQWLTYRECPGGNLSLLEVS